MWMLENVVHGLAASCTHGCLADYMMCVSCTSDVVLYTRDVAARVTLETLIKSVRSRSFPPRSTLGVPAANGNSESAEASTDDQTDENDEDGQDTADSNGDGDEDDS